MTDKIESALSAEEWASIGPNGVGHPPIPSTLADIDGLDAEDLPKAIALANAALPEGDPRKITRADVTALGIVYAYVIRQPGILGQDVCTAIELLYRHAAKIESYLPPE